MVRTIKNFGENESMGTIGMVKGATKVVRRT
jgi:hypothetical protein